MFNDINQINTTIYGLYLHDKTYSTFHQHTHFNPITIMLSQVHIINAIYCPITRRYKREAL